MKKSFDQLCADILGENTPTTPTQNQQPQQQNTQQYQKTPTPNNAPASAGQLNMDELLKQLAELAKDEEKKKVLMAALNPTATTPNTAQPA